MDVTGRLDGSGFDAAARAEIARVRESGVLGRSGRLLELFDYLISRSAAGEPPKEVEIAASVFGKSGGDDARDDPIARGYVHRLRKRLDDFYADRSEARDPGAPRLNLPKGEYRIVHSLSEAPAAQAPPGSRIGRAAAMARGALERRPGWAVALAVGAVSLLYAAIWATAAAVSRGVSGDIAQLRRHPTWAPLAGTDRPLHIVLGDYYMFGEYFDGIFLERLVRDFSINSREELLEHQRFNPETYARYGDVNLRYLPTSVGEAAALVAPIAPERKAARVVLASQVTTEMIRDSDIIYVGLFSGLASLREPVFTASRFRFGDSYDELRDTVTGRAYRSDAFLASPLDAMYNDYALFTSLRGPTGNRIIVLAGARDAGLAGLAERVSDLEGLGELSHIAAGGGSYEALYRIHGRDQVSIESDLVVASAADEALIWSPDGPTPQFPAQ